MKEQTKKIQRCIGYIVQALLIYFTFSVSPNKIYPNVFAQPDADGLVIRLVTGLQRLDSVFGEFSLKEDVFLGLLILAILWIQRKNTQKKTGLTNLLAVVFSFTYILAESFYLGNSLVYVFGDAFTLLVALLRFAGLAVLLREAISFISCKLSMISLNSDTIVTRKTYFTYFIFIFIAWLPQLLIIYPGGYCNDVQNQLMQFFGYIPMSDPHPPLFTFIIGCCVWIGNLIKHPNVGLYLYILVQYTFMAEGLSYSLFFLKKKGFPKGFLISGLLFYSMLPNFFYYASVVIKNAPYAVCFLLVAISAYEIIDIWNTENKVTKQMVGPIIRYTLFSLIGSLICHNGFYVTIPMSLGLSIVVLFGRMKAKEKGKLILCSFVSIILFLAITKILYPAIGIEKGMDHLIYTNMLQQSSRIVLEHPEEVSAQDHDVLNKVIDFDQIKDYYKPVTSDGIKPIVNLEAPDEDVNEYYRLWIRQITKHPFLAWQASFNVSYGFLAPVARNEEHVFDLYFYESEYQEFNFHVPYALTGLRSIWEACVECYTSLPFIRVLQNVGMYTWVLGFCICYLIDKKQGKMLIYFIPGIMTFVFYLGIPSYYHHPRYAFPIQYATIFYLALCVIGNKTKEKIK